MSAFSKILDDLKLSKSVDRLMRAIADCAPGGDPDAVVFDVSKAAVLRYLTAEEGSPPQETLRQRLTLFRKALVNHEHHAPEGSLS